jgi:GNAT superfamily N-acetyltransferase
MLVPRNEYVMDKHFHFNNVALRRFLDSDTDQLVQIINKAYSYQDHVKGEPRTNPTHLRKRANEVELYVVAKDGVLIGCVYIEPRDTSLHFGLLTLVPEHRGTGLSRAIMEAIEHYARDSRFISLELDYMSLAPWLKPYYENYGFVATGQIMPWGSIDLIRMKKGLS